MKHGHDLDEEEQEHVSSKWDPNMHSIIWKNGAYQSLQKHYRECWMRLHWGPCIEDVCGRVGEAYIGWSAGVDVGDPRRLYRGCCMCMWEGFPIVCVISHIFFRVVTCLTVVYSGRSKSDAAGRFDFHINKTIWDLRYIPVNILSP